MEILKLSILFFLTLILIYNFPVWAGTMGKIAGVVTDKTTGEMAFRSKCNCSRNVIRVSYRCAHWSCLKLTMFLIGGSK